MLLNFINRQLVRPIYRYLSTMMLDNLLHIIIILYSVYEIITIQ